MPKAFSASTWEENLGKELTGGIILGAGYYKAYHGVPEGYEWNKAENPSNKASMNIQAILGQWRYSFGLWINTTDCDMVCHYQMVQL